MDTPHKRNLSDSVCFGLTDEKAQNKHDLSGLMVEVLPKIYEPKIIEFISLQEIIEAIQSHEVLKEKVSDVRNASTEEDVKRLKKKIPAFRPCCCFSH